MTQSPLIQNYLKMFRNFAKFSGRASRTEYWWAMLMNYIIILAVQFLIRIIESFQIAAGDSVFWAFVEVCIVLISLLYSLVVYIPMLALQVRRLHDVNRSGWWVLFSGTGIGGILLLVWYCTAGAEDTNLFGSDPHPIRQY